MWYCFIDFECLDCGHEFSQSADTLTIASGEFGICKKCGSKNTKRSEKDSASNNVENFIEELNEKLK